MTAVRGLEDEYAGRVQFELVSPEDTEARHDELVEYGLGSHGLVVLDPDGVPRATLPGHEFGEAEIRAALAAALP